jgi:acyl carrier protein
MSDAPATDLTWRDFANTLGEVSPGSEIKPETRLVEDLGLDSLALAELITFLMETYGAPNLSQQLEDRVWEGVTAGTLFEECEASVPRPSVRHQSSRP